MLQGLHSHLLWQDSMYSTVWHRLLALKGKNAMLINYLHSHLLLLRYLTSLRFQAKFHPQGETRAELKSNSFQYCRSPYSKLANVTLHVSNSAACSSIYNFMRVSCISKGKQIHSEKMYYTPFYPTLTQYNIFAKCLQVTPINYHSHKTWAINSIYYNHDTCRWCFTSSAKKL